MAAWTEGVLPLRRAHGFRIDSWTAAANRFIWLLQYDGPGMFDEADARYYASPERQALDPDPAQWIIENETIDLVALAAATKD